MDGTTFAEIEESFGLLDDWEDRYRYLIELGREMPPLPEPLRTEGARVHGCASRVWLVPRVAGTGPEARVSFEGESDAMIVRGLIAVLRALVNGRPAREIAAFDALAALRPLGLDQHLSSQRSNGLRAMVARMREVAADAVAS